VAATTCACWSSRLIVAGGSLGCPVYQPICSWLPPSIGTNIASGGSAARASGPDMRAAPASSVP
jgi:hypothetical protein